MADTGYNLHKGYDIRYFNSDESLPRLLKGIRAFVKGLDGNVETVNVTSRYDDELEEIVFEGYIVYTGVYLA